MQHDHKTLVGEHPFGHFGQYTILGLFAIVWVLDSFVFRWSVFLQGFLPWYIRVTCAIIIEFIALYLSVKSIGIMFYRQNGEKPFVVEKSVYKWVRHPMYLGTILFYLGLIFMTISLLAAVVLIAGTGFYHYIARYEEELLLKALGDEYRAYMKRVGMWLPIFRFIRK